MYYLCQYPNGYFDIYTISAMSKSRTSTVLRAIEYFRLGNTFDPEGKYQVQGSELVRHSDGYYENPSSDIPPFQHHGDIIAQFESFDQLKHTHPELFL